MVHVLPKVASFGEEFGHAVGSGASKGFMDAHENKKRMKQLAQEDEQIFNETGISLKGHTDPEMRKAVFIQQLKGQQKEQQIGQKQKMIQDIFGNGQKNQLSFQDQLMDNPESQDNVFDSSNISDQQLAELSAIDPNISRSLQHSKDVSLREKGAKETRDLKKFQIDSAHAAKITDPIFLELNQSRKNIPLQEQAIEDILNAVPEVNALDYFADITGFEPARSASGAKLKTAIKDFFLSDLTRAGSRPNMWIEQQLADALPKIGRSEEANLVVAEGMKFKVNLAKKRIELIDELAENDHEKYGFAKPNIDSRASKLLRPYVEEQKRQLKESIQKIKSNKNESKFIRMTSPDGSVYDIDQQDLEEAEQHGFKRS